MLTLKIFIKGEFFDQISGGTKKIEYRQVSPFWTSRLYNKQGKKIPYQQIEFINGMRPDSRRMVTEFSGFLKRRDTYHIQMGRVLKRNFK